MSTYRNGFLSEFVALQLKLFVFLQRAIEEANDVYLGGLKCICKQLDELEASIELSTARPVCVSKQFECITIFVVVVI